MVFNMTDQFKNSIFSTLKYTKCSYRHLNLYKMPVNEVDISQWNEIISILNNLFKEHKIHARGFVHTASGGISASSKNGFQHLSCYEVRSTASMHECIINCIVYGEKITCRVQYWHGKPQVSNEKLSGTKAFKKLKEEFSKNNINLEDYYISNGKEIKQTIPKPLREMANAAYCNTTISHCYHIDINSAYPFAMTLLYPEWKPTINKLYEKRHGNPIYKNILNFSYGYFQSRNLGYKLAHVSKYCIEYTIQRLHKLSKILSDNNCTVISYNTDGIWFKCQDGRTLYALENKSSKELGYYKLDHKNCTCRFKSANAYEYIENNKYNVVYSGLTTLDKIKPRSKWKWGDIYKATEIVFTESNEYGIINTIEGVNYDQL